MSTLRAVLLGLIATLAVAAPSSAAIPAASTCAASRPTVSGKICRVEGTSTGLRMTLLQLDPALGQYRLLITSAKPERLTKLVRWTPPADMRIMAITDVATGRCSLSGGRIACVAAKPGPSLSLDFTVNGIPIDLAPPPGHEASSRSDGERKGAADAKAFLGFLDPSHGLYRLTLQNTSGLGLINTFSWVPPERMTIRSITSSAGGTCRVESNTLSCRGARQGIAPPRQGTGTGGSLTVDFLVGGLRPTYSRLDGAALCCVQILTMTPVPWHIGYSLDNTIDFAALQAGPGEHQGISLHQALTVQSRPPTAPR